MQDIIFAHRCCSDRGKPEEGMQNVYIDGACIGDKTLEAVIETLIGSTQQTATRGGEEESRNRKSGNITSSRSRDWEESSHTNSTNIPPSVNVTSGEQDSPYSSNECAGMLCKLYTLHSANALASIVMCCV